MKLIETITPKQAVEELGVPYHGWMREMDRAWISDDAHYSVMSRLLRTEWGKVEHVTITAAEGVGQSDGSGDIPWAVKMQIKNELFGEKRLAIEVFPTQDRLVREGVPASIRHPSPRCQDRAGQSWQHTNAGC